jgi:hypothetical protein
MERFYCQKWKKGRRMIEDAYTDFVRFMDEIFFEGYAEQLASEHPEEFTRELNEYFNNYFKPNEK